MKALITGVTGFVGSHLADYLIDGRGVEVHGIRRPRSRDEFTREGVEYHNGDVTDFFAMAEVVSKVKPDCIFHLASQSDVHHSWEAPKATFETNITGTLNVLEAVRRFSLDTIVQFAGTCEEYGYVSPEESPVDEDQPLRPQSPYAVSKVAGDLLCQQYHKSFGVKVVITRAFNHTGPRRGQNFVTSKIAHHLALIKLGRAEGNLKLGNMESVRDYADVRDMVRAYWLATQNCIYGQPYNVGSGIGRSVKDVLATLCQVTGITPTVEQDPRFMRPSDAPLFVSDSYFFTRLTGWKPEIPFEQTARDLFDYWVYKLGGTEVLRINSRRRG